MDSISEKITSIDELPDGALIALPNDPTNEGRSLLLLANKGYISLEAENELEATPYDIVENPKSLVFRELGKLPSYPGYYLMLQQPLSIQIMR